MVTLHPLTAVRNEYPMGSSWTISVGSLGPIMA